MVDNNQGEAPTPSFSFSQNPEKAPEGGTPTPSFSFTSPKEETVPVTPAPLDPSQLTYEHYQELRGIERREEEREERSIALAVDNIGAEYSSEPFQDFWLETDILNNRNFEAQKKKFKREYPKGNLIVVPVNGKKVLLGRPTPNTPYKRIGGLGPTLTAATPEVGASIIGGLPRSFAKGVFGTFALTAGTDYAESKIEEYRGFETPEKAGSSAVGFGLTEAGIEAGLRGIGGFGKLAGVMRGGPETVGKDLLEFMRKEDLPPLAVGQTAEAPAVRQAFEQTSETVVTPGRLTRAQRRKILDSFIRRIQTYGFEGMSQENVEQVVQAAVRELDTIIKPGKLDKTGTGRHLVRGLEAFEEASRRWVSEKYARAFSEDTGVFFDISDVQKQTRDLVARIESQGISGGDVVIKDITQLPKDFQNQVSKVLEMNPTVSGWKGRSGFEQIKELRTQFYDYMHSDNAEIRRIATPIYSALTNAMKNPVGGTEEFIRAFTAASKANAFREGVLERGFIARALNRTDDPMDIVNRYFTSDRRDEIRLIKRIVPKNRWSKFEDAFANRLLQDPKKISQRLANFDEKTRRVIMPKAKEDALQEYEKQWAKIDQSRLRRIEEAQRTASEKAKELVQRADSGEIAEMVRLSGGRNSNFAQSLKAGIYYDIINNATEVVRGEQLFNITKLRDRVRFWKKKEKLGSLLTEKDWEDLLNYEKYTSYIKIGTDAGGSIRSHGLTSQARQVHAPHRFAGAWLTFGGDSITSRVLAKHSNILRHVPSTTKYLDTKTIRMAARAVGAIAQETPEGEEEE